MVEAREVAAHVVRLELEEIGGERRVLADAQVGVEVDGRHVDALQQVADVAVHFRELGVLALVLGVDGVQLLVDAVQLLVDALQLLVGSDHLLVGRLQLLVGCLQLLHGRLQVAARLAELLFQRHQALGAGGKLGRRGVGRRRVALLQRDEVTRLGVLGREALGREREAQGAVFRGPFDHRVGGGARLAHRARQRSRERQAHFRGNEVEEVGREAPRRHAQELVGAAVRVEQRALLGEQEGARHEALEERVVGRQEARLGPMPVSLVPRAQRHPRRDLGPVHGPRMHALAIELAGLGHRVEAGHELARRLARAEEHHAADTQPVREARERAPLRLRPEVDQQVAARHQVEVGEGRIGEQVVLGEDDLVADLWGDLEAAVGALAEVGVEALDREAFQPVGREDAGARRLQGALVHVGREDLERPLRAGVADRLVQRDGDRARLLACGAARDPGAQLALGLDLARGELVELRAHRVEAGRVAEEGRDADEKVVLQRRKLAGIALEESCVVAKVREVREARAPLHSAEHGAALVLLEVHQQAMAHQRDHFLDHLGGLAVRELSGGHVLDQRARKALGGEHRVRGPGLDRRAGHAVEGRRFGIFHQHQPARGLDAADAARAVGARARKDHRDRARLAFGGERDEELVDREGEVAIRGPVGHLQAAVGDLDLLARRQQVDVVGLHPLAVTRLAHRDGGKAREQLLHEALVVRREVLDDHEGHAGARRHRAEEAFEGFEPARRGTYPGDERANRACIHGFLFDGGRWDAKKLYRPPINETYRKAPTRASEGPHPRA